MDFEKYLDQAWQNHAAAPEKVVESFDSGISLIKEAEQLPAMAQLMCHVFGEHLGHWEIGVENLQRLAKHRFFREGSEADHAIRRFSASLRLAGQSEVDLASFSVSDQIRVYSVAASALLNRAKIEHSEKFFHAALELAQQGLLEDDPAHRSLAVIGHNLACQLEEQPDRSENETNLMILAAQCSRRHWEFAGSWLEVERSEYRLAMSYLKAQDWNKAFEHITAIFKILDENQAPAMEYFFAYEALGQLEIARRNLVGFSVAFERAKGYFDQFKPEDKEQFEDRLKKLVFVSESPAP